MAHADFQVREVDERFVVRLVIDAQIKRARDLMAAGKPHCLAGSLVDTDGGFNRDPVANRPWTWHLDPETIAFPDLTTEVGDGKPSDIEADKNYWLNTVKTYTPWQAVVEREL